MKCGGFSMIGIDGREVGVYPLRCKRWGCEICGPRKARATMKRIRAGMTAGDGPVRFFTITSPGGDDPEATYREFPARWKRLHQRIVRRFGRVEYLGVVEPQRRGAAHIHVVYRGPYIPQRWLSRAAAESGFGPIAHIRRSHPRLITYLAKYLTKDLAAAGRETGEPAARPTIPRYFRRVRWSRGWCVWERRRPTRRWSSWRFVDAVPRHAAQSARDRGYRVVELVDDGSGRSWHPGRRLHWLTAIPRLPRREPFAELIATVVSHRTTKRQEWAAAHPFRFTSRSSHR